MSQPAQTVRKANGGIAAPLLKVLLYVAALIGVGYSMVTIDLPNQNYVWMVAEAVVAVLLIMGVIGNLKRVFRGGR